MLKKHHHSIKQTIASFLFLLLVGAGLFFTLQPNVFTQANYSAPEESYDSIYYFPETTTDTQQNVLGGFTVIGKSYIAQPQGLPVYLVDYVVDGNTILVNGNNRVRLIGIKAPDKDEELGIEATDFLKELVEKKEVYLQVDEKNPKDEFGRVRGIIYQDKRNINIEMLRSGLAHVYPILPSIVGYEDWIPFQNEARDAKRGLWNFKKEEDETNNEVPVENTIPEEKVPSI